MAPPCALRRSRHARVTRSPVRPARTNGRRSPRHHSNQHGSHPLHVHACRPRHAAPWRVPRVHTHNSHAHTNLYHAKLSSNKHPLSLTWRLSRPTIALVLQGRRGAPSPSFRGKKGQCVHTRRTRSIAHCFDSAPAGLILRPCCSCHRLPRCVHRRHRLHCCAACRCRQRRAAHPHGACAPCSTPAGAPPTAP